MSFSPVPSFENEDCAGELGPFEPRLAMLASVDVLSRPVDQLVEKTEGPTPKGDCPTKLVRWGMEPARSLESRAALLAAVVFSPISPRLGEGDL
jgi:hypothetical protein